MASKFGAKLRTLRAAIVHDISKEMQAAGSLVVTEAQISISTGSVSGKNHVVSAPNTAPNNDTATLANGIRAVQVAPLRVLIESTAPYSAALEFGTSKMAPRPFMVPAAVKTRPEIERKLSTAVARATRRHFKESL